MSTPPEHTHMAPYPTSASTTHMRRRPSRITPTISTADNSNPTDNRISRASYYTSGTDRTSRYSTCASEEGGFESAREDVSVSVEEYVETDLGGVGDGGEGVMGRSTPHYMYGYEYEYATTGEAQSPPMSASVSGSGLVGSEYDEVIVRPGAEAEAKAKAEVELGKRRDELRPPHHDSNHRDHDRTNAAWAQTYHSGSNHEYGDEYEYDNNLNKVKDDEKSREKERIRMRHESVSSQATARPSSFNFRESSSSPSNRYLSSGGNQQALHSDTERTGLGFPTASALTADGASDAGANAGVEVISPADGVSPLHFISPNPFSTPPSSLKSGSPSHSQSHSRSDSLELSESTSANKGTGTGTSPSLVSASHSHTHTRNPSASYTRGPNPPMTTLTRNRRKSAAAAKTGNGNGTAALPSSSSGRENAQVLMSSANDASGTMTLMGISTSSLGGQDGAGAAPSNVNATASMNGRGTSGSYSHQHQGSGSYFPPFAPNPHHHHHRDSSLSSPSTSNNMSLLNSSYSNNSTPNGNTNMNRGGGFSITPLSGYATPPHPSTGTGTSRPNTSNASRPGTGNASRPGTGTTSRPGTGTHTPTTERETFSSPPMYIPPTPPRGSFLPFVSVGAVGGGSSGTSTPTGSNSFERSRTSSGVGLTMGMGGGGGTSAVAALAFTQHVPGLGGFKSSVDGTPYDTANPTGSFTPTTGTGMSGDDPFQHGDDGTGGGLGLRVKTALLQGEVEKPWLEEKDWRIRASWWITFMTIMLGVAASAFVCFRSWNSVLLIEQPLCLVMQDDFNTFNVDQDGATWRHEVDMSGFGNGEFEMTTNSPNNSFVQDGKLYIVPTLTEQVIGRDNVFNGYTFNITGCTNSDNLHGSACGAVSNQTSHTVINPIMSARITTQKSHSIRYGRVEIRAKLPTGDWLWPALWMLPVNNTYGPWPLSGEIDIMEARGNSPLYPHDGNNVVRGSLNWGPLASLNAAFRTFGTFADRHHRYSDDFHTYVLEWTPTFLRTYVDSRLLKTLQLTFDEPFFTRGQFPPVIQNGSQTIALQNPWFGRPNSAPFDQPFFLIMNVAVGGTNGWFPDGLGDKPWVDASETAMYDFAKAQDKWYPTWPADPKDRAMVVDYVKMWELC